MLSAPRLNSPIVQSSPREPQVEEEAKRRPFHCVFMCFLGGGEGGREGLAGGDRERRAGRNEERGERGAGGKKTGETTPQWHRKERARTVEGTVALYDPPAASELSVLLHCVVPEAIDPGRLVTTTSISLRAIELNRTRARAGLTAIVGPADVDENGGDGVRALVGERELFHTTHASSQD